MLGSRMLLFLLLASQGLARLRVSFLDPTPIARTLQQFADFSVVVHFHNRTATKVDVIFASLNFHSQPLFFLNYDTPRKNHRPPGYKHVHLVVLADPFVFGEYAEMDYNFMPFDFIFIVVEQYERLNFTEEEHVQVSYMWDIPGLKTAAAVMIFVWSEKILYNCCYYCGNETGVMKLIAAGDYTSGLRQYLNRFKNFNGHVLKIAYAHFPPFFSCRNQSSKCDPIGSEAEVLKVFSEKYNFQYNLVQVKSELSARGAWQAIIEAVHYKKVDMAVGGISVSMERGVATDYARFIKTQGFSVMYATYDQLWVDVKRILLIFTWTVWICIVSSVIAIAFLANTSMISFGTISSMTFSKFARLLVMPIVEQATPWHHLKKFTCLPIRILLAVWWLMLLCLTSMYKSQLASSLIKPNYGEPVTIDELVAMGFKFQANHEDWSVLKENFRFSSDKVYTTVLKNIDDELDFCDSVRHALVYKLAVIDEEIPIQYNVYKMCDKFITPDERSRLRLLPDNLFPNTYHGWCMPTATPFRKEFSRTIGQMDACGLINHWYGTASTYKLPKSNKKKEARQTVSLTIQQVFPPLLILGVGLSSSLLVFLQELFNVRKPQRVTQQSSMISTAKLPVVESSSDLMLLFSSEN